LSVMSFEVCNPILC